VVSVQKKVLGKKTTNWKVPRLRETETLGKMLRLLQKAFKDSKNTNNLAHTGGERIGGLASWRTASNACEKIDIQ